MTHVDGASMLEIDAGQRQSYMSASCPNVVGARTFSVAFGLLIWIWG